MGRDLLPRDQVPDSPWELAWDMAASDVREALTRAGSPWDNATPSPYEVLQVEGARWASVQDPAYEGASVQGHEMASVTGHTLGDITRPTPPEAALAARYFRVRRFRIKWRGRVIFERRWVRPR